jgi:beta-galactosidase
MHFGADYYPEHWVFPYDGTAEDPEGRWEEDARLMAQAGMNVVRMGEFCWGICEREEGKLDFTWLRRAMDCLHKHDIRVVLSTPTAAPPIWLLQKHPEILPLDERGERRHEGTRRAYSMSSDIYWDHSKRIVRAMATALGDHPALVAWQIDNGIGRHNTEYSFNPETRRDWQSWLRAKYETIARANECLGLRFWGQMVTDWSQIPMPMNAPAVHNPALMTDWRRFSSDTCVAYVRMQADLLRGLTPTIPVTTSLRAWAAEFDYFDMADAVDFVSVDSDAAVKAKSAEIACSIDLLRCLKKTNVKLPGGGTDGFWVIEQKAGNVSWQDVNSMVRPGIVRLFTYQLLSRGANGVLYFYWRQPRIGPEKFYGGVLRHNGRAESRMYEEISSIGAELKQLEPVLAGSKVVAETAIMINYASHWAINQPLQPNRFFHQREHIQLFYTALHDRNIPVDFVRPGEELSAYKLVIAPSLHLLSGFEADQLKLFVQNGGTLISTFNTGLVDEHHIAPTTGYPHELCDLFGLEVVEFDTLPVGEENHITVKGSFPNSGLHPARLWCDLIEPQGCQTLAVYSKDFYAGRPVMTVHEFGQGRAVYIGTMSHQNFYYDLVTWARQLCNLYPLLKVPDTVEVSMRQKGDHRIYFLLNHQPSSVRIQFYKPAHDFLTGKNIAGNYDLPPHGILVVDEHYARQ